MAGGELALMNKLEPPYALSIFNKENSECPEEQKEGEEGGTRNLCLS